MTCLPQFENKQIVVLGLGLTGMSVVRFLAAQQCVFSVNDSRANAVDKTQFAQQYPMASLHLGQWQSELIASADVLIVSPGVDTSIAEIAHFIQPHCEVMGDVELFCQLTSAKIIAVTGSNGKSTVVSLLAHMANTLNLSAVLAGNIGVPVLDTLEENPDYVILELSSFQLETIESMKAVAVTILNISDDHLDRHHTLANYRAIKQKIFHNAEHLIFNREDTTSYCPELELGQIAISYGLDKPGNNQFGVYKFSDKTALCYNNQGALQSLIAIEQLPLAGKHNQLNFLAALALANAAGWNLLACAQSLSMFKGLAHRCEIVSTTDGVTWVNDSKATNVGATLAAISGLASTLNAENKLILIAGGEGKGADFSPLKTAFTTQVSLLIVLGKDADKLARLAVNAKHVDSIEQAVTLAASVAQKGDMVLLSPACASLDMFKNYEHRGLCFANAVKALSGGSHDA
jgi:UDP-N-acetylmuramoylalanine--D-glutamate ligase